jgi:type IV pilus assembly protein PilA
LLDLDGVIVSTTRVGTLRASTGTEYFYNENAVGDTSLGEVMKRQKGFSLIELLIVVAIILIIAAIAIPNLMRSKMAANEASAVGSIRTVVTAETTYASSWGIGYAADLVSLGSATAGACTATSTNACLLDPILSTGTKSGYTFAAAGNTPAGGVNGGFEVNATPISVGQTGQRSFCSDQSGVIRFNTTGAAIGTGAGNCAAQTLLAGN